MRFFFDYTATHHSLYDYKGSDFNDQKNALGFAKATAQLMRTNFNGDWIHYYVEVRDAEGKRYFSVPVHPDQPFCIGPHGNSEPLNRLLIIEDRHIHSAVIGRSARRLGFAVTEVRDYDNACELLEEQQFDCITLDLGLGDRVGLDVLRHLAGMHSKSQIIVISETDQETRDDVVELGRALDLSVLTSIPKPIDLQTLREMLRRVQNHTPT